MTLVQLWRRWTISANVCLYLNYIFKVIQMPSYYYVVLACGSVTKVTTQLEVGK